MFLVVENVIQLKEPSMMDVESDWDVVDEELDDDEDEAGRTIAPKSLYTPKGATRVAWS